MSELRIIELLEGLCGERLSSYTLSPAEKGTGRPARWVNLKAAGANVNLDLRHKEQMASRVKAYCADLIERFEDQVAAAIRSVQHDADGEGGRGGGPGRRRAWAVAAGPAQVLFVAACSGS